jgi:hypothetical protein
MDLSSLNDFLNSSLNSILRITFTILYDFTTDAVITPNLDGCSLSFKLSNESEEEYVDPLIINGSYYGSESGIKTAIVEFNSTNNLPPKNFFTENNWFGLLSFDGFSQGNATSIKVYDIIFEIELSSNIGALINVYDFFNDIDLVQLGSVRLGSHVQGDSLSYTINIKNIGDRTLTISSISSSENLFISTSINERTSVQLPLDLEPGGSQVLEVNLLTNLYGSYTEFVRIQSSSLSYSDLFIYFIHTVVAEGSISPLILGSTSGSEIINNKTLTKGNLPVDVSSTISVSINNAGSVNLNIGSVYVYGNGSIADGSLIGTGAMVQPSSSKTLLIDLETETEGDKKVNVSIFSNDIRNNPFNFSISYSIVPQSKIELLLQDSIIQDEDEIDIGSIVKNQNYVKRYNINNAGVYKSIIINSITSSSKISVISESSFPFILLPNKTNSLNFSIKLDTSESGLKSGTLVIDYDEGSII